MCGILGAVRIKGKSLDENHFVEGLKVMHHRGPDSHGIESFAQDHWQLLLGHVRLSIIDLSPGGHQPKKALSNKFWISFNGEIYNYKELRQELKGFGYSFETDSDTEVLLVAWEHWGKDSLAKLKGMFAFAIYDVEARKVFLIRDGFGIKPIYYSEDSKGLNWGSELSAIRKIDSNKNQLNAKTALTYLLSGSYDHTDQTFIEGIQSLKPGCLLEYSLEEGRVLKIERWYNPSIQLNSKIGYNEAVERTRELFLESIRFHLRSDVSLGAALSGGIDSSSIVSAIRHIEPDIELNTFSYVARGYPYNEEKWVDIVNERNRAIPHKFTFSPEDITKDFDELVKYQGEPFASSSIYAIYRTYREAKVNGVTVTLDGQGADEAFAGYSGYPHATIPSYLSEKGLASTLSFINKWSSWKGRSKNTAIKILLRTLSEKVGINKSDILLPQYEWIQNIQSMKREVKGNYKEIMEDKERGRDLSAQLKYALTHNGLPNLLRTGDRSSMRWTVESRVPFLYPDLVEFALSLPAHYHVSPKGESKHLFRTAMRGIVPNEILDRKDKIGAKTPDREILNQLANRDSFISKLRDSSLVHGEDLHKQFMEGISSADQYKQLYWRIFNLFEWMSAHEIKEG